jgi:XTP/dITP diphosphohydrolase
MSQISNLVFATNNKYKLDEIRDIFHRPQTTDHSSGIKILSLKDINCTEELEESGETLEANALQKAVYVYQHYHYNCFADDTGLEIEALDGKPGVYSARYAGLNENGEWRMENGDISFEDNIRKVLEEMDGKTNRKACFRTVICLVSSFKFQVSSLFFEGRIDGIIINEKRGTNGFGYDPIFMPDGYKMTFAEMTSEQKNSLSHRYLAIDNMLKSGIII